MVNKQFVKITVTDITKSNPYENMVSVSCKEFQFARANINKSVINNLDPDEWEIVSLRLEKVISLGSFELKKLFLQFRMQNLTPQIDIVNQKHPSFDQNFTKVNRLISRNFDMDFTSSKWLNSVTDYCDVGINISCTCNYSGASQIVKIQFFFKIGVN